MRIKSFILSLSALFLGVILLSAQEAPSRLGESLALITENPDRAANNVHSYEFHPIVDTKAPSGFKPFYISHYGRHGSRYEQHINFSRAALAGFRKLDSLGLLTSEGKAAYRDVKAVTDEHLGLEGALSPRGGREHQLLAKRMAQRFPAVFSSKDRNEVFAVASTVQRCILSMNNFTVSLASEVPTLKFTFGSGVRYQSYVVPGIKYADMRTVFSGGGGGGFSRPADDYDYSRIYRLLFNDVDKALSVLDNAPAFVRSIYDTGSFCQDLDFLGIDIFRTYFTPEELTHLWEQGNDTIYALWANSVEIGDNVTSSMRPLLRDFVGKADDALRSGSHKAADLRFGHDTAVLPLLALLGLDDPDSRRYNISDAHNHWFAYEQVPMATNVQMIFYRNKKNEVLIKILYNEKECRLNNIPAYSGPYYRWNDVREWFLSLCE